MARDSFENDAHYARVYIDSMESRYQDLADKIEELEEELEALRQENVCFAEDVVRLNEELDKYKGQIYYE